jgi:hypothetical protein
MPDTVQVEVTRIVELKEIVDALRARGLEPQVVENADYLGVEIPCDDAVRDCDDVYAEVESWISETGSPLVPMKLDETSIFLRHPLG